LIRVLLVNKTGTGKWKKKVIELLLSVVAYLTQLKEKLGLVKLKCTF